MLIFPWVVCFAHNSNWQALSLFLSWPVIFLILFFFCILQEKEGREEGVSSWVGIWMLAKVNPPQPSFGIQGLFLCGKGQRCRTFSLPFLCHPEAWLAQPLTEQCSISGIYSSISNWVRGISPYFWQEMSSLASVKIMLGLALGDSSGPTCSNSTLAKLSCSSWFCEELHQGGLSCLFGLSTLILPRKS